MTIDAVEFIRRFLLHVLPPGFVKIRHFGFLANGCRAEGLKLSRILLRVSAQPDPWAFDSAMRSSANVLAAASELSASPDMFQPT
jgi:hypothetical protein